MSSATPPPPIRFVAIGGGTGLSTLLRGLKRHARRRPRRGTAWRGDAPSEPAIPPYIRELTAVVTVTDDGGSSGRLRRALRVLPPGDVRNCLVALSEDEALMSRLFQYRFVTGWGLRGHNLGNLFLAGLTELTGDFAEAVRLSSEVLAVQGRIYPSTTTNVHLEAELENGQRVSGETKISRSRSRISRIQLAPADCHPLPDTLEAIADADVITLGPGSLFTSIVPNLLVRGVAEAVIASRAVKVYVGNLMTQPGETTGFTAAGHIRAIYSHSPAPFFHYALLNSGEIPAQAQQRYRKEQAEPVAADLEEVRRLGVEPVLADLTAPGTLVRHDPARLASEILELATRARVSAADAPR